MSAICSSFQSRIVTRLQDAVELLALSGVIVKAESRTFGRDELEAYLNGTAVDTAGIVITVMMPQLSRTETHRLELTGSVLVTENPATNETDPATQAEDCALLVFALLDRLQPPSEAGSDLFTPIMPQSVECVTLNAGLEDWVVALKTTIGIGITDAVHWTQGTGAIVIGGADDLAALTGNVAGRAVIVGRDTPPEASGIWFYRTTQTMTADGIDVVNCNDGGQFECLTHF